MGLQIGNLSLAGRVLNAGCGEGLYASLIEEFPGVTSIVNLDASRPSIARQRDDRRHEGAEGEDEEAGQHRVLASSSAAIIARKRAKR